MAIDQMPAATARLGAKLAAFAVTLDADERTLFAAILAAARSSTEVEGFDGDDRGGLRGRELNVSVTTVLAQPSLPPYGVNWQTREPTKLPNEGNFNRF